MVQLHLANASESAPVIVDVAGYCIDILEVNGVSVDMASGHVYWTDAQRERIEMTDYEGNNRRVVIHTDLLAPRALVVDPGHG